MKNDIPLQSFIIINIISLMSKNLSDQKKKNEIHFILMI